MKSVGLKGSGLYQSLASPPPVNLAVMTPSSATSANIHVPMTVLISAPREGVVDLARVQLFHSLGNLLGLFHRRAQGARHLAQLSALVPSANLEPLGPVGLLLAAGPYRLERCFWFHPSSPALRPVPGRSRLGCRPSTHRVRPR